MKREETELQRNIREVAYPFLFLIVTGASVFYWGIKFAVDLGTKPFRRK